MDPSLDQDGHPQGAEKDTANKTTPTEVGCEDAARATSIPKLDIKATGGGSALDGKSKSSTEYGCNVSPSSISDVENACCDSSAGGSILMRRISSSSIAIAMGRGIKRMKFNNVTRQVEYTSAVIGGCLLSVNAGYLNAITYLEAGLSCSNMTGNALRTGTALGMGAFADMGRHIVLMLAFTLGSALTGLLGGNYDNFHLGHSYGRVFCLCFAVLLLALFAERFSRYRIVYVTLCCVACGLQNAMTTKFSGNMIRTTHVTGSLTDIGIALGRMWRGRHDQAWKLGLLVPLVLCYIFGGVLGAIAFQHLNKQSLLINVILFGLTALLYSMCFSKYFKVRFWEALLGVYDFAEEGKLKGEANMDGYGVFDSEADNNNKDSTAHKAYGTPAILAVDSASGDLSEETVVLGYDPESPEIKGK